MVSSQQLRQFLSEEEKYNVLIENFIQLLKADVVSEELLPVLIEGLGHKKWLVRRYSAEVIEKFFLEKAVPSLRGLLESNNVDERFWALKLLGLARDKEVEKKIIEMIASDKDELIRVFAALAYARLNLTEGVKKLFAFLTSPSWEIRNKAAYAMEKLGQDIIPYLIVGLQSSQQDISYWSYFVLERLLETENCKMEVFINLFQHKSPEVRRSVCRLFSNFKDYGTFKLLLKSLTDENWLVRREAATSLIKLLKGRYLQFQKDLLSLLRVNNEHVKYWTIRIIVELAKEAKEDIKVQLTSSDVFVKRFFSKYIGKWREKEYLDLLFQNLGDRDRFVREYSLESLLCYDPEDLEPYISKYIISENDDISYNVTILIGKKGEPFLRYLYKELREGEKEKRLWVAHAFRFFKHRDVLLELMKLLTDEYWPVREMAAKSLLYLGEYAFDELLKNIRNENPDIVFWTKKVLKQQIPSLTAHVGYILQKGSEDMKFFAAWAAKDLKLEGVVPDLLNLLMSGNDWVRNLSLEAILEMGKIDELEKAKDSLPPVLKKEIERIILEYKGIDIEEYIEKLRFGTEDTQKEVMKELVELGDAVLEKLKKAYQEATEEDLRIKLLRIIRAIETGSEFGLMF